MYRYLGVMKQVELGRTVSELNKDSTPWDETVTTPFDDDDEPEPAEGAADADADADGDAAAAAAAGESEGVRASIDPTLSSQVDDSEFVKDA